ncbi:glycoside hydrolase family 6 protein [Nonomuraea gerenzanensis]|uniref:Glucanase n=1 Tax=Nonomuraea gerenzanensis TaxID=93944 RepID=A0A1M4EI05_9ACTN|nr:glycoside hydrolase family 6 protein [Nonomuraea gerenzanensis]UBU09977.1 glycoside hydrolase family 6 protein [Nonomuraea gerenzanensis]SBO98430.1 Endoglucanase [Nonomuraea gerenzanensis]
MRLFTPTRAAALAAVLTAATLTVPPPASAAAQLITNGTFTGGTTTPWTAIGQTAVAAESERMRIEVTQVVANPWDAMVAAPTTAALNPGKSYTLSFDAYSTVAFTARATVQYTATPSSNQSLATDVRLTTGSKRYSIPFTAASASATAAEVTFQLGGSGGRPVVRLDNVSLMETQTTRPASLYVSPLSHPAKWAADNGDTNIMTNIGSKPIFEWFGGWFGDLTQAVDTYVGAAQAQDRLPMLVAYNIPNRDACAGHSGGGAGDAAGYHAWITEFAKAIGTRHAIVVLEPDGVAAAGCVTRIGKDPEDQYRMLLDATQVLRAQAPNAWVYLDAGNATWIPAADMAPLLVKSGIANSRGFAVNVSNYFTTADSETYATAVKGHLAGTVGAKTYVIDTSRNGNGPYVDSTPEDNWCNPPRRKLGTPPRQQATGAEYLFWVKVPGDSDGPCGIAGTTPAGTFSPDLARALINGNP